MAEDEENVSAEEEEESEEEKKSPSKKKFLVIGIALIVLGAGGFGGWKFFLAEKTPAGDGETGEKTEEVAVAPGIMHKMEPFIVNLLDQGGKRYLKTQFQIEIDNEKTKTELDGRSPQIRDAILLLLTSKTFAEIGVPEGKIELRTELIQRVNDILTGGAIRNLYFTEFVIQ